MAEVLADFVTVLSSDMIAEIVEAYFNKQMYKKPVKVVDLKPHEDGYAFSLAFISNIRELVSPESTIEEINSYAAQNKEQVAIIRKERDDKGRFVKH